MSRYSDYYYHNGTYITHHQWLTQLVEQGFNTLTEVPHGKFKDYHLANANEDVWVFRRKADGEHLRNEIERLKPQEKYVRPPMIISWYKHVNEIIIEQREVIARSTLQCYYIVEEEYTWYDTYVPSGVSVSEFAEELTAMGFTIYNTDEGVISFDYPPNATSGHNYPTNL